MDDADTTDSSLAMLTIFSVFVKRFESASSKSLPVNVIIPFPYLVCIRATNAGKVWSME